MSSPGSTTAATSSPIAQVVGEDAQLYDPGATSKKLLSEYDGTIGGLIYFGPTPSGEDTPSSPTRPPWPRHPLGDPSVPLTTGGATRNGAVQGEPGADGSNFWIRGISSFQGAGTSPLVLVDGIERTLDDLNPAEIESFSVLKDASASAVYGVRGANGVILVQTKRGKLGKPTVNVHFEQSFTQPTKLPQYIGSAEYLTLLNEIAKKDNGQQQSPYSQETIDHYINRTDPDLYPDVNWMDLITKDFAMNQRADITVNGGSDILRYAVVGSYYGEQGIFERDKSQKLEQWNTSKQIQLTLECRHQYHKKTTQLTVSVGGYLQEMNKMAISSDDAFSGAFETPPFIHPAYYKEDDNIYFPVVNQRVKPYVQVTQKDMQQPLKVKSNRCSH